MSPRHRGPARAEGEVNDTDARLWRPWLRINRHMRWPLVLACLVLASPVWSQERSFRVIEKGTGKAGDHPTVWEVTLADVTPPGHALGSEFRKIGEGLGISQAISYYFAGIEGRTIHLYAIERPGTGGGEIQRLPILLPLAADDTAVLTISPRYANKSVRIRLKKNADNSLAASVIGP